MNLTAEIGVVRALIDSMHDVKTSADIAERNAWKNQVYEIWENTDPSIMTKLSYIELAYNKNVQRGLTKPIEIQNNDGDHVEYNSAQLYNALKMAEQRLVLIVANIVRKYNIVIPFGSGVKSLVGSGMPPLQDLKM